MAKLVSSFRTRFQRQRVQFSVPDAPEERRTKTEFADDCDINKIMARYRKTGVLPDTARAAAARYGDFSEIPPYQEMRNRMIAAEELFAALPAVVRKEFDNDPGLFIQSAQTPEGRERMVKLGLGKSVEAVSSPLEAASSSGGGQPPKASPKGEREPNEAPKTAKTESKDE